jgi:hypothetical protein
MPDLIDKFFRTDLTEAEESALGEMLRSSDEAAQRFGRLSEEAWRRFGLPDPDAPASGAPAPAAPDASLLAVKLLGAALALFMGVGGWVVWKAGTGPAPTPAVPMTAPEPPAAAPEEIAAPGPSEDAATRPARSPGAPPVGEGTTDHKSYKLIKVVVNQAAEGQVVVRVLGPSGDEVKRLYQGRLAEGRWSFGWDGRAEDGTAALPGTYSVEIRSDAGVLSREVVVK